MFDRKHFAIVEFLLGILVGVLLLGVIYIVLTWFNQNRKASVTVPPITPYSLNPTSVPILTDLQKEKLTPSLEQSALKGILIYDRGGGELWKYELGSGQEEKIVDGFDQSVFCVDVCPERFFSVSRNGRVVFDLYKKNEEQGFAYIDLVDLKRQPIFIHSGVKPIVNPSGTHVLFDYNPLKLVSIDGTNGFDWGSYINPIWSTETEFYFVNTSYFGTVFKANLLSKTIEKVEVSELVKAAQEVYNILPSPNGKMLLLSTYRGAGYDVGVVSINGSNYSSLLWLAEQGEAWAGSGYYTGVWSPDGSAVVVKDWFIPADRSIISGSRELKIVNIATKKFIAIDAKTDAGRDSLCWIRDALGNEYIAVGSSDDNGKSSIRTYSPRGELLKSLPSSGSEVFVCL